MPTIHHGPKKFRLHRDATQRWHLLRTMCTQLVENERIRTTKAKAKALRPMIEKVIALGKKNTIATQRKIQGILTTEQTRNKILNQIAPRFANKNGNFTRVTTLPNRVGDKAPMAYIEILKNDIEIYEKAQKKQQLESGQIIDKKQWEKKTFAQERQFLIEKLEKIEEELKIKQIQNLETDLIKIKALQISKKFFEEKIRRVDHDLQLLNKNPIDLRIFPVSFS